MRRREFITLLGSAAAVWPAQTRGQRLERMRFFMNLTADDAETQARRTALVKKLRELGWVEGRNIQIDYRFGGGSASVT
jgi:putative ABC transport system substrate-binding protein